MSNANCTFDFQSNCRVRSSDRQLHSINCTTRFKINNIAEKMDWNNILLGIYNLQHTDFRFESYLPYACHFIRYKSITMYIITMILSLHGADYAVHRVHISIITIRYYIIWGKSTWTFERRSVIVVSACWEKTSNKIIFHILIYYYVYVPLSAFRTQIYRARACSVEVQRKLLPLYTRNTGSYRG